MKTMLSSIDYVVECRDYRVPVTSINPAFEAALENTRRLIVYTKRDLGTGQPSERRMVSVPHFTFLEPDSHFSLIGQPDDQRF